MTPKGKKPKSLAEPEAEAAPAKGKDLALVLGASEDGSKVAALRQRGDHIEAALLSRVQDGEALHGEVVQLTSREEPNLYDVETVVPTPAPSGRPAQVATKGYRSGWGRIFGGRGKRTLN